MECVERCIEYLKKIKGETTNEKSIIELNIIIGLLEDRIPIIEKSLKNNQ